MRLDHVNHAQSASLRASAPAARPTAASAAAAATTDATGATGATFTFTESWQWSASLQVSLVLNGGPATTPATVGAPDREVEGADGGHHGRAHVSQLLRQLSREVRHELKAIIENNPDLDPAVRDELRDAAKAFRDDLRTAFHDAGRGHDFDPAALLDGVQQALSTLADRLGALVGGTPQTPPAEPVPVVEPTPVVEPEPERPAGEVPTETPVPAAA